MIFQKSQWMFPFVGILVIAMMSGCGGDDESESVPTPEPDPGPRVTIEHLIGDEVEGPSFPAEDGWFQVRVKAKPAPKDQDLVVRVRLLFTDLNISEEQVTDLKDDAFDNILWFRVPKLEEASSGIWIRSTITAALEVVALPRRHKFEYDTEAVDGSTIPEWWVPSPYQVGKPAVLIQQFPF